MKRVSIDFERFKSFLVKYKFLVVAFIFLLVSGLILIPKAFAQPVKSVEISSDSASFEEKDPGAWKVDKSAKWTGKGEAEITFDVDTIKKTNDKDRDVLLILDISGSMYGSKLSRVQYDTKELVEYLLSNQNNKVGLISFATDSTILSDFTNDKDLLIDSINKLSAEEGSTNYYNALQNAHHVLKHYQKQPNKDCLILFLTDGYPNLFVPSEIIMYDYLKSQYPYTTINGIQYEMGDKVLDPIEKVSDNQFIANMSTLSNVLFDAVGILKVYDKFEISDYIDTRYFYVENEKAIKVDHGEISFDEATQKITWNMDKILVGTDAEMKIKIKLKDEYLGTGQVYSTNEKEEIHVELDGTEENIESKNTPILSSNYKVVYEGNAPNGCILENVPSEQNKTVFDTVKLSDEKLECAGYQFKGWKIVNNNITKLNADFFSMPEEDVVIRAEWSKLELNKNIDGEVYTQKSSPLKKISYNTESRCNYGECFDFVKYESKLHEYSDSITKIVLQDKISPIGGTIETLDLSEEETGDILANIVPNQDNNSKYTAYIQGNGKIVANKDSSYLFAGFSELESIEGLENLDTSNVTNMTSMFGSPNIKELNLIGIDTSRVTNMSYMFAALDAESYDNNYYVSPSNLSNIKLGVLDTSKVTNMSGMFSGTSMPSENIDLFFSRIDTSNVTDMSRMFESSSLVSIEISNLNILNVKKMNNMFESCYNLESLSISGVNTSNEVNMNSMFRECRKLTSLDLSNFDTSNATDMYYMFAYCSSLTSLDLSNFDTSKVTDMSFMFRECKKLTSLDLSSFDTSNATNMYYMFAYCSSLTSLNLSNFDTSSVTNMSNMFSYCNNLTNLNLSSFDTTNVVSMGSMFQKCSSLTSLDLSNFNTPKVTSMCEMFTGCSSLTSLELSNFNTSSVTDMNSMFYSCSSLTSLELSNFNTSSITDMNSMFYSCSSLTSLELSNFNTSSVTNMNSMFYSCSSLTSLNLSSFDTSSVTNMNSMFQKCSSLTSLNLSSFDTSNVTIMVEMFSNCSSLTSLDLSNFNTINVTDMSTMFRECGSLTSLNLSNFDTSNVTDMGEMFSGCSSLTSLDLSNFDMSNVTRMDYMFRDCSNLNATITLVNKITNSSYYYYMFRNAATAEGTQITVNYTENVADVIDKYIGTKSSDSNVVKGELVTIGT